MRVSRSPAWWRRIFRFVKAWGDVTADLLKRLGMNVDFVATDWGTVVARRAQKSPPGQGGWHMFHILVRAARIGPIRPASRFAPMATTRASAGRTVRRSRPRSPPGSTQRRSTRRRAVARRLNKAALDHVVYAPLGFFLQSSSLAQERHRHRAGAAAVLLGGEQDRLINPFRLELRERFCRPNPCPSSSAPPTPARRRPRRESRSRPGPSPRRRCSRARPRPARSVPRSRCRAWSPDPCA